MTRYSSLQGRDLAQFRSNYPFKLRLRFGLWKFFGYKLVAKSMFNSSFKCRILRIAGAKIGDGVILKSNLKVHFPWNLQIGDQCWIGEDVWFINHELVVLGSNVCISQRSVICSGGHDYKSASLEYSHKPIEIKDGAWICLDAKILSGVTIGECSVISAGEVVRKSVPDYSMFVGGQTHPIEPSQ